MKRILIAWALLLGTISFSGQGRNVDSIRQALNSEKNDEAKIELLCKMSYALQYSKPDSSLLLAQRAYFIAKNINYQTGESMALGQMAAAYKSLGNFPKALEYYITQLKILETKQQPGQLATINMAIASVYTNSKDFDRGLRYHKKADSIIRANNITDYAPYSTLNIGDAYEKKNMLDSALLYTNEAHDLSVKSDNPLLVGTTLNNLGNIYSKAGNFPAALGNYKAGIPYELSSSDYSMYAESTLGVARVFERTGQTDSAVWYGRRSFEVSSKNGFTVQALDASIFLSALYHVHRNIDSAFAYQEIQIRLKDSIGSSEKIKELQNISSAEQLRQAELDQLKQEQVADRKQKLQLLFIGIMIPFFFLLSIVISQRKVHRKLIEFTGIVSVLLFFEYITLLLHPFIAEKSHHSPIIEIIIFVAIAAIITPAHHKIEHWLLNKLAIYNAHHHKTPEPPEKNITEELPDNSSAPQ